MAAASPWLRSLLLSVPPDLGAVDTSTETPVAEIVLIFDGYSSSLVRDSLACLEAGILLATSSAVSKQRRPQKLRHSEADILNFLLPAEDAGEEQLKKAKNGSAIVTSPSFTPRLTASFSIPVSAATDDKADDEDFDLSNLELIVKCEPETSPDAGMNSSLVNDEKLPVLNGRVKHKVNKALVVRTRQMVEKNLWGLSKTKKGPNTLLKNKNLRRSQRKCSVKSVKPPVSVSVLLSNWKEKENVKVLNEQERRRKHYCQPCDRGFKR